MPKPKIFISYTTNDRIAVEVSGALFDSLDGARPDAAFEVLLDRESLKPGDNWRLKLHNWIGLCDAAIILLSENAIDTARHPWVWNEAAILAHRRFLQEGFVVLPVVLPPVEVKQLGATQWEPLALNAIQIVAGESVPAAVRQIVAELDKFKDELGTEGGPLQELELLIASELSGVDEPIIRRAAAKLDFEFGPWRAGKDERREFAGKLLQADLERLPDALKELAKTSKFEDKAARNVIKHVLPFRISALAVAALPGIATRRPAEQRSVFLCAHAPRTGELCVRRAWCGVESWIVVTPDGVSGEDDVAAMVSKIWGIFKRKHLMDETKSLAEVKSWVERHLLKKRKEPLFIVLPEGVSAEVVAGVREEFKGFTVIILVGERATGDEIDLMNGAAHFLEPFREAADKGPPDEDPEQQVEDVYFELCSILGRRS